VKTDDDHVWLWSLDLPTEEMPLSELSWQLRVPFWIEDHRRVIAIDVLRNPRRYPDHFRKMLETDLRYPIHIYPRGKKLWIVLDGTHRLLKSRVHRRDEREGPQSPSRLRGAP
jgi:hypothetical protein